MLRDVLSVAAGFLAIAAIVMIGSIATMALFVPGGLAAMKTMKDNPAAIPAPSARYYAMNFALSAIAAIVGGWLTATIAGVPATGELLGLVVVVLAMGIVSALAYSGTGGMRQPAWYRILIPLVGAAGVVAGGSLVR